MKPLGTCVSYVLVRPLWGRFGLGYASSGDKANIIFFVQKGRLTSNTTTPYENILNCFGNKKQIHELSIDKSNNIDRYK
ncbi:hypothetical protein Hanom_Chr06g00553441 [Helianthus anomalus]